MNASISFATLLRSLALPACLVPGILLTGCAIDRHTVVVSTGTTLGVEVAQDQTSSTPRIKVGYNRAELALVPSNRSAHKDPGSRLGPGLCPACAEGNPGNCTAPQRCKAVCEHTLDGGAADTAEVLMEIRMGGGVLFSGISDGGVYQRLAVGKTAVQQPGASLMFARNKQGEIDAPAADALKDAVDASEKQRLAWALEEVKKQKTWVDRALDECSAKETKEEKRAYLKAVLDLNANDMRDLTDERLEDRQKLRKLLESTEWYPKLKNHFAPDAEQTPNTGE